jgi:hypothetical protein
MGLLKIFKRNSKMQEAPPSALADAKAQKIAEVILGYQRRLAGGINRFFARIGIKRTTYLLLFLGVVFWCYCGYVLLRAIIN